MTRQQVRVVRHGADLAELDAWLAANHLGSAHDYISATVDGDTIVTEKAFRDEHGGVVLEGDHLKTTVGRHMVIRPLPAALSMSEEDM